VSTFLRQVAIVTGAARGIGLEIAQALHELGASVVVADRDGEEANQALARFAAAPDRAMAQTIDVTDPDAVDALMERTVARFGRIDILVHSAGIGVERMFLDTTLELWEQVIRVDLTGTFLTSQAAARTMIHRGYGRIIHLASTAGIRGGTGRAAYGAAKGGVIALTRVMAVELAPYGITVNALAPGAIETQMVRKMHSAETRTAYRRRVPLDRYGEPSEVAAAATFLASPAASYVTGHVLAVDGGFLAAGVMHRSG
jgi:NAD(P)-dependent dehydrogenase (short-subunit alcohol dehydrogenase family)